MEIIDIDISREGDGLGLWRKEREIRRNGTLLDHLQMEGRNDKLS